MERHKCKLCLRTFANGRALGGHMRSHMLYRSGSVPQEETGSASLSLSSDEAEEIGGESMCYGLRENPKRSIKLADPEFSFVEPVPVQDRESEAESAKNPVRRRSNRFRNPEPGQKRAKPGRVANPEWSEPVSSVVSDTTTEEDVAFCLMMMKRDKWRREKAAEDDSEDEEEDDDDVADVEEDYESADESTKEKEKKMMRNKYKCETCNKVFKSYQALGGHRASHKRAKIANYNNNNNNYNNNSNGTNSGFVAKAENEEKRHECPICFRVFSSGQALGGHKRSHVMGSSSPSIFLEPKQGIRIKEKALIDLNLPAPVEDEEDDDVYSQIELSALSEADFVMNSNRH